MISKTELDKEGNRVRVYHRAGLLRVDGAPFPDQKYIWTHPYSEKDTCVACTKGTIPQEVKAST